MKTTNSLYQLCSEILDGAESMDLSPKTGIEATWSYTGYGYRIYLGGFGAYDVEANDFAQVDDAEHLTMEEVEAELAALGIASDRFKTAAPPSYGRDLTILAFFKS